MSLRGRKRVRLHLLLHFPQGLQWLGLDWSLTRNKDSTLVPHMGGRDPAIWSSRLPPKICIRRSLESLSSQSWAWNPGVLKWHAETFITTLNTNTPRYLTLVKSLLSTFSFFFFCSFYFTCQSTSFEICLEESI